MRLVLGGRPRDTIAPGETVDLARAARGGRSVAEWELVRPLSADNKPMGEEIRGAIVLRGQAGPCPTARGSGQGDADYFAPLDHQREQRICSG